MFVYYKLYRNRFLPRSRHLGVKIREKNGSPRCWGCAQEGKKRSSFYFIFNKRPTSLLANWPLLSQPQQTPHKHETEVAKLQYLLHWH